MDTTVTIHPMRLGVRGGRKTIISEISLPAPQARIDNALLKALARAHRRSRQIEDGEYATITDLAKANKVNPSYACRLLRLTLLAPTIVTGILNGRHNNELTLKQLTKPFPFQWDKQPDALKLVSPDQLASAPNREAESFSNLAAAPPGEASNCSLLPKIDIAATNAPRKSSSGVATAVIPGSK